MDPATLAEHITKLANEAAALSEEAVRVAAEAARPMAVQTQGGADPFVFLFTVFVLACFVGWQVVWNVKPALHTPLMSVTNAISGIIIVGGMLQAGTGTVSVAALIGAVAILFASINIFGGFLVTQRMLQMFRREGS